jgi:hypothetical protein
MSPSHTLYNCSGAEANFDFIEAQRESIGARIHRAKVAA